MKSLPSLISESGAHRRVAVLAALCVALASSPSVFLGAEEGGDRDKPVRTVVDPGVVTTRQSIAPAGVQSVFDSRVEGVAFGASSESVRVIVGAKDRGSTIYDLDWRKNRVEQVVKSPGTAGIQSIAFDAIGQRSLVTVVSRSVPRDRKTVVQLVAIEHGEARVLADNLGSNAVGGIALATDAESGQAASAPRLAAIPLTFDNKLAVVDLATGAVQCSVKTGIAPFGAVLNAANTFAYVTNWGGRFSEKGDRTAPTGHAPTADQVVVDGRGIAASGTVSGVDVRTGAVVATIPVGLHPTSLAWDERRNRLYVANSNSDSITIIDTQANRLIGTIALQPFVDVAAGLAPEALVLSKDGGRLYAACAGINAIAVIETKDDLAEANRLIGLIPTGWYPAHLALSPDGRYLAVSTLLGVGSGANTPSRLVVEKLKELDLPTQPTIGIREVHLYRGTVHVIAVPDEIQLAGYTIAVAENNHMRLRTAPFAAAIAPRAEANVPPAPVPDRIGQPSPIKHVVYIIKENRTYDQLFGNLGVGNGDPTLELWGEKVTPNHRNLARQFVVLDNFFATGGDSGDGHQWVTQASETDYTYWPGYAGRSYPFDGSDPLAYASGGFIWNAVIAAHQTFADCGEFAGNMTGLSGDSRAKLLEEYKAGGSFAGRFHVVAPIASLNPYLLSDYPSWSLGIPDVVRANIFLHHLQEWEKAGAMPNLVLMHLPSDHTQGTRPDFSTPAACVADNDLALGQIVEALSHSKFWPSIQILVVEDDAADGIDHVDGHRTIALAIGPYVRRGAIDSTFYSQPSMLKTIEHILGLPNLSIFDLIANDMRNSFQAVPDLTPYTAMVPQQSIYEVNKPTATLSGPARRAAVASLKMNFSVPDAAPTQRLNEILWHQEKGWQVKYPAVRQAVFAPYALEHDDDDDDKGDRKRGG